MGNRIDTRSRKSANEVAVEVERNQFILQFAIRNMLKSRGEKETKLQPAPVGRYDGF